MHFEPVQVGDSAIVPKTSIAGSALVAIIAIMTFLASLTVGAVMLVRVATSEWQADVSRELTIQVRPVPGRDIDADMRAATEIARAGRGIAEARPYSKDESERLLEPWLGTGLRLDDLPVPRLIVLKIGAGDTPDLGGLRAQIQQRVPSASLDDHRGWSDRMRGMARTVVAAGLLVLGLVFAVTVLAVVFATRGAMAANRPTIEVLHFVGAENRFIANHFQEHFLWLGMRGGAIGGGSAVVVLLLVQLIAAWTPDADGGNPLYALFGSFSLGISGYAAVLAQVVLVAAATAITARQTVNRTLQAIP